MSQKLILNIKMIWMIIIKILKSTTQMKKQKILIVFDDMTADLFSKKKNVIPIVTELFIKEEN